MLEAVADVGAIRAREVQDGRDHFFPVEAGFRRRDSVGLPDERRAAGCLFAIRRLADRIRNTMENLRVRSDRLLGATRHPLPTIR